jgi:hypothetical protein
MRPAQQVTDAGNTRAIKLADDVTTSMDARDAD